MADAKVAFEGWGASGVAWGDQGWGVGHSNVTGTGAVGSVAVTADANVYPSGLEATGQVGNVLVQADANVFPTGVQATGAVGTVVVVAEAVVQVTGVYGTGYVGTTTVIGDANVYPSGLEAVGQVGTVVVQADAIVEVTETGSSLRANKLRIIETVLESNTQLIANTTSWQDAAKRKKLEDIKMLLDGAIAALGKVGLMLNVEKKNLDAVLGVLPALKRPTISTLSEDGWLAVNTILEESTVRTIIPRLKSAGAQGIVEYPLNKIIM